MSHCRRRVVAVERHVVVPPPELDTVISYDSGPPPVPGRVLVNASNGTAQRAFHGLPNYPRESALLSAWYYGTRDRAVRLPTNRRFRARLQRVRHRIVAHRWEGGACCHGVTCCLPPLNPSPAAETPPGTSRVPSSC